MRFLSALFGFVLAVSGFALRKKGASRFVSDISTFARNERNMVAVIVFIGIVVRCGHLFFIGLDVPFRYGGLFVEFSRQIATNGYLLPANIPFYTQGGIPFAYPPLAFYVQAFLIETLSLPKYAVVNLLPPLVAVLSLPSFYLLTRALNMSDRSRLGAVVVFALLPNAFLDQIEGGGLAESFGTVSLIWFAIALVRFRRSASVGRAAAVGLCWALCILSSPGSAYGSVPMFLIFAIGSLLAGERGTGLRTFLLLAGSGIVAVVLSVPYWGTVLSNHGVGVFTAAVRAQQGGLMATVIRPLTDFLTFDIATGSIPFLWNVLIFSGVVWGLLHRRWTLLAWFVVFQSIPREGAWMVSIPAALLAGMGTLEGLLPGLQRIRNQVESPWTERSITVGFCLVLSAWIGVILFATLLPVTFRPANTASPESIAAMTWIRGNTPEDARVITLCDDYTREWVPEISRRTVPNMRFGAEWQPGERSRILRLDQRFQECEDLACVASGIGDLTGPGEVYLFADKARFDGLLAATPESSILPYRREWGNNEIIIVRLTVE
jgi:hypothetical protein